MQVPAEILRCEILDWWEGEREKIARDIPERLPALLYQVDTIIDEMPIADLLNRRKFIAANVEPIISTWMERLYKEFTHELDESFRASANEAEGGETYEDWSYRDVATAGAAIAVTAAPAAGIPFFAGGFTVAGTALFGVALPFSGGGLAVGAVVAATASVALLAAGPAVRFQAASKLKNKFKNSLHKDISKRALGASTDGSEISLKQLLFDELLAVSLKRMDMVN